MAFPLAVSCRVGMGANSDETTEIHPPRHRSHRRRDRHRRGGPDLRDRWTHEVLHRPRPRARRRRHQNVSLSTTPGSPSWDRSRSSRAWPLGGTHPTGWTYTESDAELLARVRQRGVRLAASGTAWNVLTTDAGSPRAVVFQTAVDRTLITWCLVETQPDAAIDGATPMVAPDIEGRHDTSAAPRCR